MSWTKKNVHPGKILSTSEKINVELLEIDVEGQWERPGRIYLVQDRPIETEILSIMPEVSVSEYNWL